MARESREVQIPSASADPCVGEEGSEWGGMDRRGFMKFLSALGVSIGRARQPLAGAAGGLGAGDGALRGAPLVFVLEDDYGVMEVADMDLPRTRRECLGLDPPATAEEMIALAEDNWRVEDLLAGLYLEACGRAWEESSKALRRRWQAWLRRPRNTAAARRALADWLEETSLDEFDQEYANDHGNTPQGAALCFWQAGLAGYEDFDVTFLAGSIPGSGIVAVRLDMDVAEANRLAISRKLPVRFTLFSPPCRKPGPESKAIQ